MYPKYHWEVCQKEGGIVIKNSNDVVTPNIIKLRNRKDYLKKKWPKNCTAENYISFIRSSRKFRQEVH